MVIHSKDMEKIMKGVREEFQRLLGIQGNQKKAMNIHFLITKVREADAYQLELVQKLNGVIKQMNADQAKIILLENFIDRKELGNEYQEFLIKLEEKFLQEEEKVPEDPVDEDT